MLSAYPRVQPSPRSGSISRTLTDSRSIAWVAASTSCVGFVVSLFVCIVDLFGLELEWTTAPAGLLPRASPTDQEVCLPLSPCRVAGAFESKTFQHACNVAAVSRQRCR